MYDLYTFFHIMSQKMLDIFRFFTISAVETHLHAWHSTSQSHQFPWSVSLFVAPLPWMVGSPMAEFLQLKRSNG